MKAQTLASSLMLAGLTRGLWMGAPVERSLERRGTLADAASWRTALQSDAEMPGITREDHATDSARTGSDRS